MFLECNPISPVNVSKTQVGRSTEVPFLFPFFFTCLFCTCLVMALDQIVSKPQLNEHIWAFIDISFARHFTRIVEKWKCKKPWKSEIYFSLFTFVSLTENITKQMICDIENIYKVWLNLYHLYFVYIVMNYFDLLSYLIVKLVKQRISNWTYTEMGIRSLCSTGSEPEVSRRLYLSVPESCRTVLHGWTGNFIRKFYPGQADISGRFYLQGVENNAFSVTISVALSGRLIWIYSLNFDETKFRETFC